MSNLQVNKLSTKDGSVDIEVRNLMVRDSAMENLGDYEEGLELKTVQQYFIKDGHKFVGKAFQLPIVLSGDWDVDKVLVETYGEQWDHDKLYNKDIPNAHNASAISYKDTNVAEALDGAVIYAGSVEEIESKSLPVGTAIFLTEEGRAGEFVVKTGTPPSDPQKGIYIVLANGNYAERVYSGSCQMMWFYSEGDQDHTAALSGALSLSGHVSLPVNGSISLSAPVTVSSDTTIFGNNCTVAGRINVVGNKVLIENVNFDFSFSSSSVGSSYRCLNVNNCSDVKIIGCSFNKATVIVINDRHSYNKNYLIENCIFSGDFSGVEDVNSFQGQNVDFIEIANCEFKSENVSRILKITSYGYDVGEYVNDNYNKRIKIFGNHFSGSLEPTDRDGFKQHIDLYSSAGGIIHHGNFHTTSGGISVLDTKAHGDHGPNTDKHFDIIVTNNVFGVSDMIHSILKFTGAAEQEFSTTPQNLIISNNTFPAENINVGGIIRVRGYNRVIINSNDIYHSSGTLGYGAIEARFVEVLNVSCNLIKGRITVSDDLVSSNKSITISSNRIEDDKWGISIQGISDASLSMVGNSYFGNGLFGIINDCSLYSRAVVANTSNTHQGIAQSGNTITYDVFSFNSWWINAGG